MPEFIPGFGWIADQAGEDVGTAIEGNFPSPTGMPPGRPVPCTGPQLPPRGPDAAMAALARMIFPPRIEKLIQSTDFQVRDYAMIVPAGVGQTVTSAALSFVIPTGQLGWLQEFSIYTLTPTALTSIQWTVRINGAPVPGFDKAQNPPGIANLLYITADDMRIRLPGGCTVDILLTNLNANGPWTAGGDLAGWYHSESAERRAWNLDL